MMDDVISAREFTPFIYIYTKKRQHARILIMVLLDEESTESVRMPPLDVMIFAADTWEKAEH